MIVNFEPEHVRRMVVQPDQEHERLSDAELRNVAQHTAVTLLDGDRVVACLGLTRDYGVWLLWGVLSVYASKRMVSVVRCAERLAQFHAGTLYMAVRHDFKEAHRAARMLKFKMRPEFIELPGKGPYNVYERFC